MLPDQPIKLRWDVAISMVCVLVSVLTPYRMAFAHNNAMSWLVFDAIVDVLFVVGERAILLYWLSEAFGGGEGGGGGVIVACYMFIFDHWAEHAGVLPEHLLFYEN